MSLRDSIRDELYGPDEDSVVDEVALPAYSEIIESASDPRFAFKVLAITVPAEVGLIAMFLAADNTLAGLLDLENYVCLAMIAFAIGFLIAFPIYRLIEQKLGHRGPSISLSPGVLSGYTGHEPTGYIGIWFISAGAGVLNVFLFYALLQLN